MRGAASFINIGALFFAAGIFAGVAHSKNAYAGNWTVGNFGHPSGSFHGRPNFAHNHGFPFRGRSGFDGGFGRRDFGTNVVVVPSAVPYGVPPPPDYGVPPAPYYGVSPPGLDSLKCYLHRHVETPNGPVLEPVYVC
jgi:hypothetical protein